MTLVEPSNTYFADMSNKTKLLLCNLFLQAHEKLLLYKWKLISLLAVNIYPSIHQFIVPCVLMIWQNYFAHAVLPWTFSSVNTLPLNPLFIINQLMGDDFPTSLNTWLHGISRLQVFTSKLLNALCEIPFLKRQTWLTRKLEWLIKFLCKSNTIQALK